MGWVGGTIGFLVGSRFGALAGILGAAIGNKIGNFVGEGLGNLASKSQREKGLMPTRAAVPHRTPVPRVSAKSSSLLPSARCWRSSPRQTAI